MNSLSNFFRSLGWRTRQGFANFMQGRYGADKLNLTILGLGLVFSILSSLLPSVLFSYIFSLISYGLLIWAVFRSLSRNTYARYAENQRYLQAISHIKDRDHRYYHCPHCRQMTRVPRGKGKINITCPRCGEKFQRRS